MEVGRLNYLPICMCMWFLFTFILTYVISVVQKDVEPIFPYISDTGTFTPTSCIFGQLLNTGSVLSITVYIRYLQIKDIESRDDSKRLQDLNNACLLLGWLSSLGVSIVGNFQETEVFTVHIIGALMSFGLAAVYQILQWRISSRTMKECGVSASIVRLRLVLAVISLVTFFTCFTFAGLALMKFTGEDMTKWTKADGGYTLHLVSTITEWICGIATMCYIFTFGTDFKRIRLNEPTLTFVD